MARTPKPKRKRRVPVDPLKAQVNAYAKTVIKPYQGLLNQAVNTGEEEAGRLNQIEAGTQRSLGGISDSLASGYGALQRAHADAQRKAVEDLAGQSGFLNSVLGGDFAKGALGLADTQGSARSVQEAASDRLMGQSALGDIARSRAASQVGTGEALRASRGDWLSRQNSLRDRIAGVHASRPFIRRQFERERLQDRLDLAAGKLAGWTARTNADIAREGQAYDALADAGRGANDAKKAADKKRAGYDKLSKSVYNRLWTVGPIMDSEGNPTTRNRTYAPAKPLTTSLNELINAGMPPALAARYAAKWTAGNEPTWGNRGNLAERQRKAQEIAALMRGLNVPDKAIANVLRGEYGATGPQWGLAPLPEQVN